MLLMSGLQTGTQLLVDADQLTCGHRLEIPHGEPTGLQELPAQPDMSRLGTSSAATVPDPLLTGPRSHVSDMHKVLWQR